MSLNRSVLITGCGIVSAIGLDCGQVLDSLLQVRTGVGPLKYLRTGHTEFPVGEVKLSDEEMERMMGIAPGTPTTRTALMGMIALHEALGQAGLNKDDLKECGFVNGTTVGGDDPQPVVKGDVNGDGEVNIADVNALIDMILSGNHSAAGDVNEDNEINMIRDDVSAAEYSVNNDLRGVDIPTLRTSLTSKDAKTLYMLSNKNNKFGFHSFGATNVPARKAYFTISSSANARPFSMVFEDETTAIRPLLKANAESSVYDLNGRAVNGNNLKPGIYVKNGKKIVVK